MNIAEQLLALKTIKNNIKNAIIAKGVEILESTPFSSYADKIASITGGTLGTKTITANGTYNAEDDNLDGYSTVITNVSPNLSTKTIKANGTYNASSDMVQGYSQVTVNVPSALDKTYVNPYLKDNVIRTCESDYHCYLPSELDSHITQTNGTFNADGTYKGDSDCYLSSDETLPLDTANSWEFGTKYTYNIAYGHDTIWGYTGGSDFQHPSLIFEGSNSALIFYLSSTGTGWDLNSQGSSLEPVNGTTYYIKAGFTGDEYYIDYNTTGWNDNFTRVFTLQSTTKVWCSVPAMLMNLSLNTGAYYAGGLIHLPETYVKINGAEYRRYAAKMQPIF